MSQLHVRRGALRFRHRFLYYFSVVNLLSHWLSRNYRTRTVLFLTPGYQPCNSPAMKNSISMDEIQFCRQLHNSCFYVGKTSRRLFSCQWTILFKNMHFNYFVNRFILDWCRLDFIWSYVEGPHITIRIMDVYISFLKQ